MSPEDSARLQREVNQSTLEQVAAAIGISPTTLARLIARQGSYESCKRLARIYLNGREV
jgi:hypothetical protein